jgi:hypothetical protein
MQQLRANDFSIGMLEGWRDASQVVLIGPERQYFTPNVQVHREPPPSETLEEYVRLQRAELMGLESFKAIAQGDRLLGGVQAYTHEYSWLLPSGSAHRVQQRQLICANVGALFTLTFSALEQDWDQVEGAFEMILSGFRWG